MARKRVVLDIDEELLSGYHGYMIGDVGVRQAMMVLMDRVKHYNPTVIEVYDSPDPYSGEIEGGGVDKV
jgi:hypothetical protein